MKKNPLQRVEPRFDEGVASAAHNRSRLSPLAAAMIQSLGPVNTTAAAKSPPAAPRKPLLRRTWRGVTVSRYADGLEIAFSDGRKFAAPSVWRLLLAMVQQPKA